MNSKKKKLKKVESFKPTVPGSSSLRRKIIRGLLWFFSFVVIPATISFIYPFWEKRNESNLKPEEKHEREYFVYGELKSDRITKVAPNGFSQYRTPEYRMRFKTVPFVPSEPTYDTLPVLDSFPRIEGIRYAPTLWPDNSISFGLGRLPQNFTVEELRDGVNLFGVDANNCIDKEMYIGIKDDRLYVNVEFKDLTNNETIGIIEFNRWKLYKPNLLSFKNNDRCLEVRDKQNNIVFSIGYELMSKTDQYMHVSGYFMDESKVWVVPNDQAVIFSSFPCIPKSLPSYRDTAQKFFKYIHSIFDPRVIKYTR